MGAGTDIFLSNVDCFDPVVFSFFIAVAAVVVDIIVVVVVAVVGCRCRRRLLVVRFVAGLTVFCLGISN